MICTLKYEYFQNLIFNLQVSIQFFVAPHQGRGKFLCIVQ